MSTNPKTKKIKISGLWSEQEPDLGKMPRKIKILGYSSKDFQNGDIVGVAYRNEAADPNAPPSFVDTGSYIAFSGRPTQEDMLAAMELFSRRHPGKLLQIHGDSDFCEESARIAIGLGIEVANPELQEFVSKLKEEAKAEEGEEENYSLAPSM